MTLSITIGAFGDSTNWLLEINSMTEMKAAKESIRLQFQYIIMYLSRDLLNSLHFSGKL
jgi:hypothetical protein